MKKSTRMIALIFTILFSCINHTHAQMSSFQNSVSIEQDGKLFSSINMFDTIQLKRVAFVIRFDTNKYNARKKKLYATRIAAVTHDSGVAFVKMGQSVDNIPFFSIGTGLAAEEFGYNNLFIDDEAHHYIFYSNEKERRAELISTNGDKVQLLWNIPMAFYKGEDVSFEALPINSFYLIFFNDSNLNKVVDEGEFLSVFIQLQ